MKESLAQKLKSGRPVLGSWHVAASPSMVEVAARSNLDCVMMDVQHGSFGFDSLAASISLIQEAGCTSTIRIASEDYAFAGRAVDAGVDAVIAPMINNAADAEHLVSAIKYPPIGSRSWGPFAAMKYAGISDGADYLATANDRVLAFAMIETSEAVENLEEILAVDGIDGVLVGPSDLSIGLSNGASLDPFGAQSMPVIEKVVEATRNAGKFSAIFTVTAEQTRTSIELGYNLISVATDLGLFAGGIEATLKAVDHT